MRIEEKLEIEFARRVRQTALGVWRMWVTTKEWLVQPQRVG